MRFLQPLTIQWNQTSLARGRQVRARLSLYRNIYFSDDIYFHIFSSKIFVTMLMSFFLFLVVSLSNACFVVLGQVYRGVLSNNQSVAIKKITSDRCADTFLREMGSLVKVRHTNLVALMGYCENGSECFLIFELCPNGNLSQWLYGK